MHILVNLVLTSDNPHRCNIYEKQFTQISQLNQHMMIHTGENPYKCDICGKHFTQAGNCNICCYIHERSHTNVTSVRSSLLNVVV